MIEDQVRKVRVKKNQNKVGSPPRIFHKYTELRSKVFGNTLL